MAIAEVGKFRQHDPSYYVTSLPISEQADRGESLGVYRRKAEEIGLTLSEVEQAIIALQNNDIDSIKDLSDKSLNIIKSVEYPQTTADVYKDPTTNRYTTERLQNVHESIIARALENQVRGENPRLLVLAGPMAAGKSTTRKDFVSKVRSAVIADPDEIRHHLLQGFDPTNYSHVLATNQEAFDISDEIFRRAAEKGYNLIYEGTLRDIESYRKARQSTQNYLVQGVYVAAKPEDCFMRGIALRKRAVALHYLCKGLGGLENFVNIFQNDSEGNTNIESVTIVDNSSSAQNGPEILYNWQFDEPDNFMYNEHLLQQLAKDYQRLESI